jgi:hypothetical protein
MLQKFFFLQISRIFLCSLCTVVYMFYLLNSIFLIIIMQSMLTLLRKCFKGYGYADYPIFNDIENILKTFMSGSWTYGSWIYSYICNQCLSPLMLWVRISIRAKCTTLCDKVCQWLATGRLFSPGPPVSSTNKFHL